MGTGSKTYQTNVPKIRRQYTTDANLLREAAASGGGVAAGGGEDFINACLIEVTFDFPVTKHLPEIGQKVTLILSARGKIEVVSNGIKIADFTHAKAEMIKRCMKRGYIYQGEIRSTSQEANTASCVISGMGPL